MSTALNLFRLQEVDSKLDQAKARLVKIEDALNDNEAVEAALERAQDAQEHSQAAEKSLRRAEEEVKAQQIKMEQNQARLYSGSVTNPKELQDLQGEAEALKRHLETLEEDQLEKMLFFEEAETGLQNSEDLLEKARAQSAEENSGLIKEQSQLINEVNRLAGEREAAGTGIPEQEIALYESLRKSKGGLAVAKVSKKTCSACGSTLSQTLLHALRSADEIGRCDTCKRILYSG
jgi:hypothetical protein